MARSQNGWNASSSRSALGITNPTIDGVTFPGGIVGGAGGQVLHHVATQFHRRVEPLVKGWCWGHHYRQVTGGRALSNHASGTAIDINAPRHPYGKRGTFTAAQVRAIREILAECRNTVRWGGDYSRADDMHFELNAPPLLVAEAARALNPPPPRPTPGGQRTLRVTKPMMQGADVRTLQRVLAAWYPHLRIAVDGWYGPGTEAAVRHLQERAGITVDGIAGPQVRAVLKL